MLNRINLLVVGSSMAFPSEVATHSKELLSDLRGRKAWAMGIGCRKAELAAGCKQNQPEVSQCGKVLSTKTSKLWSDSGKKTLRLILS